MATTEKTNDGDNWDAEIKNGRQLADTTSHPLPVLLHTEREIEVEELIRAWEYNDQKRMEEKRNGTKEICEKIFATGGTKELKVSTYPY